MRRPIVMLVVMFALAATPASGQGLLVTGFAVDLPGSEMDDAVEVLNAGGTVVALDRAELSDEEGTLTWPAGATLGPGQRVIVAGNATAWRQAAGSDADFAIQGLDATRTMAATRPGFLLAAQGDQVLLRLDGVAHDAVVYGNASTPDGWHGPAADAAGLRALRWFTRATAADGAPVDTDTAADWDTPKLRVVGQSRLPLASYVVEESILAYVAPDASRAALMGYLDQAEQWLYLNVYEMADAEVAQRLAQAARAGVDVHLNVDESPVGVTAQERRIQAGLFADMAEAGVTITLSQHERIRYNHAKYAVADGDFVLVQSENLVATGIPVDVTHGNRGWGVVLVDAEVGNYLGYAFSQDTQLDALGARAWQTDPGAVTQEPPVVSPPATGTPRFDVRLVSGPHVVTPVLAPDHPLEPDDPILAAIHGATRSVRIQQLDAPLAWRDASGRSWPNQYLEAVADAAARGVQVRVILDAHFADDDPASGDNPDTARWLNALAAPDAQARLWWPDAPGVLHNKGLIVDDAIVFVGSLNWNLNSLTRNREVGLLIASPGLAAYFAEVFDADWSQARPPEEPQPPTTLPSAAFGATVITALGLLAARRARNGRIHGRRH